VLQPVIPLFAYPLIREPAGWALALALVAMMNLGFAIGLMRGRTLFGAVVLPGEGRAASVLRDAAWLLFAVAYGFSAAYAATALIAAETVSQAVRAALVLVLAAAVGVAGAIQQQRSPLADLTGGLAVLAVIFAAARVSWVATPDYALAITAAAVAATAGSVALLPPGARRGPALASGLSGAITALVLLWVAMPAVGAPIRAARPYWNTALTTYTDQVTTYAEGATWQLPVAALLLTLTAAMLLPWVYKIDAVVVGGALAVLTAPAALHLNWMWTPALAVAAAIGAGVAAQRVGDLRRPTEPVAATGPIGPIIDPLRTAPIAVDPTRPDQAGAGYGQPRPTTNLAADRYGATAGDADPTVRSAWTCLGAALLVGAWAAAASLTRPAATALTLAAITIAGFAVAFGPRAARTDPRAEMVARTAADAAAGGAVFAFPGAVAALTATLLAGRGASTSFAATAVLVTTYLALAAVLTYAALVQVARRRPTPPIVAGAIAAAAVVTMATLLVNSRTAIDLAVALLLLGSSLLLWLAPSMEERELFGQRLDGADMAAAAVTVAGIAALARATSLVVAGGELVMVAALVLAVALTTRSLREERWRRGPVTGAATVGAIVAALAGWGALGAAFGVIRAASPLWAAPLGEEWSRTASEHAAFGVQAPVALFLLAVAAAIAMPKPAGDDVAAVLAGLGAVAVPVAFDLGWAAPLVIGLMATLAFGTAAVVAWNTHTGLVRLGVGAAIGVHTVVASLVEPAATAGTLLGMLTAGVIVALAGWLVDQSREETVGEGAAGRAHLPVVGGSAVTGAILAGAGACAAFSATLTHSAEVPVTAALAAAAAALAVGGLLCREAPMYLPYLTAGVSGAATVAALASLATDLPAAIYAAAAALMGVLAELLRVRTERRGPEWEPAAGWRPDRTRVPLPTWRAVRRPGGFGSGVLAASAIPATVAIAVIGPAVAAALLGPYQWVDDPWTGTAETAVRLGWFDKWAGDPTDVLAAATLTMAAALAAVGLGGSRQQITERAVAVVIPGVALTLLIIPAALRVPWPVYNTITLVVAVLAGLGLALTDPPPDTVDGHPLQVGRRVIFMIGLAAAGAGFAGSLATRSTTVSTLAGTVFFGVIGAVWGRTAFARLFAWQFAAGSLLGLAFAAGLATNLPARLTAIAVLAAAAMVLGTAAGLPRLRRDDPLRRPSVDSEQSLLEAFGYLGLVASIGLTTGYPEYTAVACMATGTVLAVAAIRPGRSDQYRTALLVTAAVVEVVAIWMLLRVAAVGVPEAYTLPFAGLALLIGLLELRRRPELGSWLAYGPALVAAFAPTLTIVLVSDASPTRRVLLLVAAVLTVAIGSVRRHKAPVTIGAVVTVLAALNELVVIGRLLPWWILLLLFTATGALLISLGATYERRKAMRRFRGAYGSFR